MANAREIRLRGKGEQASAFLIEDRDRIDETQLAIEWDHPHAGLRAPQLQYEIPPQSSVAPTGGPVKYPSMPDAALADSNRRVQAAAQNRR